MYCPSEHLWCLSFHIQCVSPAPLQSAVHLTRHREVIIDTPVDGFMIGALRAPTGPPKPRTRTRAQEPRTRTSDLTPEITKIQYESEQVRPRSRNFSPAALMTFDDLRRDRTLARHPVPILKSHVLHCQWHNYTHGPSTALSSSVFLTSHKSCELSVMSNNYKPHFSAH